MAQKKQCSGRALVMSRSRRWANITFSDLLGNRIHILDFLLEVLATCDIFRVISTRNPPISRLSDHFSTARRQKNATILFPGFACVHASKN
jgi:hypothetical protein